MENNFYFEDLFEAINKNDLESIKNILRKYPDQLNRKTATGENVLHLAVRVNSPDILNEIIEVLGEKAFEFAKMPNNAGVLPIDVMEPRAHPYVLHSWDEVFHFIEHNKLPKKQVFIAAYTAESEINLIMEKLTFHKNLSDLSTPIDEKAIFKSFVKDGNHTESKCIYHSKMFENHELLDNLDNALLAANDARLSITYSEHPSNTNADSRLIKEKLKKFKEESAQLVKILKQKYPFLITTHYLNFFSNQIKKYSTGKSKEFCCVALNYLSKLQLGIPLEIFFIENSHNYILVIDRDLSSNPENYQAWGNKAVVCDPWAGKVFPATEMETELVAVKQVISLPSQEEKLTAIQFNPHYHRLKRAYSFTEEFQKSSIKVEEQKKEFALYKKAVMQFLNKELSLPHSAWRNQQLQTFITKLDLVDHKKEIKKLLKELRSVLSEHRNDCIHHKFKTHWLFKTPTLRRYTNVFDGQNKLKHSF